MEPTINKKQLAAIILSYRFIISLFVIFIFISITGFFIYLRVYLPLINNEITAHNITKIEIIDLKTAQNYLEQINHKDNFVITTSTVKNPFNLK